MKRFRLLNVLLLALVALAGWRTVDVWRRQAPVVDAGGEAARPLEGLPPRSRKPPIPQVVNAIAQQDLFDASRKEGDNQDTPAPEATPPPPPTLKLAGVLFIGLEPEAVLMDSAQGNKQIRLRVGEEISGYKVDRISTETIALVAGTGEEVVLSLLIDTAKKGKASFGPGGRQTPQPRGAAARRSSGQRAVKAAGKKNPGSFAPNQDAQSEAERRREDARRRAERARERLKRLRAEAAKNR
ncbi:MAG: hypothetical protein P8R42_12640 [Candidatus Binatia bacterium]|nr:hypothetical protein [Candidatus Binatia bacterium]